MQKITVIVFCLLVLTLAPVKAQVELSPSFVPSIELSYQWQAHTEQVTSLVFVQETGHLVSTSGNGALQSRPIAMWYVAGEEVTAVAGAFESEAGAGSIPHVQLIESGRMLAGGFGGSVTLFDAPTGRAIARIPQTWSTSVTSVRLGTVVGGENGVIGLWSVNLPPNYRENEELPEEFIFTPNQAQLITAVQIEHPIQQILADSSTGHVLVLTSIGELYQYVLDHDNDVHLNLVLENQNPATSENRISNHALAVLHPQAPHIAYVRSDGEIVVYDYDSQEYLHIYTMRQSVGCIAYVPDGSLLIIGDGSDQGGLHLFDAETYELLEMFSTGQPISSCAFNADGSLLATGHHSGKISLWDTVWGE